MKTETVALGICKDAVCTAAGFGPVERYDGPGMFCPNCGEVLQAYVPERTPQADKPAIRAVPPRPPDPTSESSPAPQIPVAPGSPNSERGSASPANSRRPGHPRSLLLWTAVVTLVAVVSAVAVKAVLDRSPAALLPTVGLCGSSVTDRLASDMARAYSARPQAGFKSFELRSTNCNVRFFTMLDKANRRAFPVGAVGGLVAHDGIVAIVNPQNSIASLSMGQLRGIFSGATHDWKSINGAKGPISVYLPDATTDESRIVTTELLQGAPVGSTVIRVASSLDVVRAVAAANGRNAIGMVAFSAAVPGKVLAIQNYPPPSIVSISEHRYPMALSVRAWSDGYAQPGFMAFATSEGAKAIVASDGFIP